MSTTDTRFRYHGTGESLFGLTIVNALLTIITFGIYSFWARNKVRQFHYSHTEFEGSRFAYHGTGGELLVGAFKALGILLVFAIAFNVAVLTLVGRAQLPSVLLPIASYAGFFLLAVLAVNGARRYRLSRSSWRGIRFSYHGKMWEFAGMFIRGTFLSVITLGFYLPHFQNARRAYLVNNARFGSEEFIYTASADPLFRPFVKAVLLTIPTLGLYWFWYAAFTHRYFWANTRMRGARLESTVTGEALLGLFVTNVLLLLLTLGIGAPWAMTRRHAFWCDNLSVVGTVDWATIRQQPSTAGVAAEGLADGLELDVGLGM